MKQYLLVFSIFSLIPLFGQICPLQETSPNKLIPESEETSTTASEGIEIGTTTYSLHTNNSMIRGLHLEEDGTLHAVFPLSIESNPFLDRGTGYNVRTNGTWNENPTERIETVRTGWSNFGKTASGRLLTVSHGGIDGGMPFNYRDEGDTEWTETFLTADIEARWPRTAVEGDNIYIIASRFDTNWGGIPNGLSLIRSFDGGDTWEQPIDIPEIADYFSQISADIYDIDAYDDKVAIAIGGNSRQTVVFSSETNGDTWEVFPIATTGITDIGTPGEVVDYFEPTSLAENVSIVIDNDGDIHVAGSWIYNHQTNGSPASIATSIDRSGILYWKEGMENFDLIGQTSRQDWDNNGSDSISTSTDLWQINNSLGSTIQPSIAVDENNNPFIAYSTVIDDPAHFNDGYFHEIFIVKGLNSENGTTWEGPHNISQDPSQDDIFPYLPTRVLNGEVNIMYQSDSVLGILGGSNFDVDNEHSIKVVTLNASEITSPSYVATNNPPHLNSLLDTWTADLRCPLSTQDIPGLLAWDYPDGFLDISINGIDYNNPTGEEGVSAELSVTDSDGNTTTSNINIVVSDESTCAFQLSLEGQSDTILSTCNEDNLIDPFDYFSIQGGAGPTEALSFDIGETPTFEEDGLYPVEYAVVDELGDTSNTVTLNYLIEDCNPPEDWATSIENLGLSKSVQVRPNPSEGIFYLSIEDDYQTVNINVFDAQGKNLYSQQNVQGTAKLQLTNITAGIYF